MDRNDDADAVDLDELVEEVGEGMGEVRVHGVVYHPNDDEPLFDDDDFSDDEVDEDVVNDHAHNPNDSRQVLSALSPIARLVHVSPLEIFYGHVSVSLGGCCVLWGGVLHYAEADSENGYRRSDCIYILPVEMQHTRTEMDKWIEVYCGGGCVPPSTSGAAAALFPHTLLVCGGFVSKYDSATGEFTRDWTDEVYELSLSSLEWSKKAVEGRRPTPRDKTAHWKWRGSLYCFGGYGTPLDGRSDAYFSGGSRIRSDDGAEWNNQLVRWDGCAWHELPLAGSVPSPRAAPASCLVGNEVFVFGGRSGAPRLNDLYRVCLEWCVWSRVETASDEVPSGRSWATMSHVEGRVVVWGGLVGVAEWGEPGRCSDEAWSCAVEGRQEGQGWRRERSVRGRYWHSTHLVDGQLVSLGGIPSFDPRTQAHVLLTPVEVRCVHPPSLQRLAFDALPHSRAVGDLLPGDWKMRRKMRGVMAGCPFRTGLDLGSVRNIVAACTIAASE